MVFDFLWEAGPVTLFWSKCGSNVDIEIKLEKRLNATFDRIHELEDALREFREKAVLEKQRYKTEVDRLKENMLGGTKRGVNIAKPIRVGAAK
nr:unnamed protein product [Spirometra erinaceieuropaei]